MVPFLETPPLENRAGKMKNRGKKYNKIRVSNPAIT